MASDNEDAGKAIGMFLLVIAVVVIAVTAVIALATIGSVFGAGTAIWNYGRALANNIRPERATP